MATVKNFRKRDLFNLLLVVVIIILINIISSYLYTRLDLTAEKRYTLSPATKELASNLEDVVYIRVYLEGEFPAPYKRLRNSTLELLDDLRDFNRENIQYEFINPGDDPDPKVREEIYRQLVKQGLQPTNLRIQEGDQVSEKIIFPGAIITYRDKEVPVQLLKSQTGVPEEVMLNNSVQQLEYEFANALKLLTRDQQFVVAFSEGHGELDTLQVKDITNVLSEQYLVERVELGKELGVLEGIDVLIVAKPDTIFEAHSLYLIDQFIMKGGKVLWLLDATDATMDSLRTAAMTFAFAKDLGLDAMLFRYGARINPTLVQDLHAAPIRITTGTVGNQPKQNLLPWFYYPLLMPVSEHPIVRNLDVIRSEFISTIDTISRPGIKKTALLHSGKYSKVLQTPVRISVNMLRDMPGPEQFPHSNQVVGVLLEGKFESAFTNQLSDEEKATLKFRAESEPGKMIVVGDGDIIRNEVQPGTGRYMPVGYDWYTRQIYGNKDFILNSIAYLTDHSGLITVRGKEVRLRLLDPGLIKEDGTFWKIFNTLVPILTIWSLGLMLFAWRKRKYTRSL